MPAYLSLSKVDLNREFKLGTKTLTNQQTYFSDVVSVVGGGNKTGRGYHRAVVGIKRGVPQSCGWREIEGTTELGQIEAVLARFNTLSLTALRYMLKLTSLASRKASLTRSYLLKYMQFVEPRRNANLELS
jgi:hypothetical protein